MPAKKRKLTEEQERQEFFNSVRFEVYVSSDEPAIDGIQRLIIASGLDDDEIADRCDRCAGTIKNIRTRPINDNGHKYMSMADSLDEVRIALKVSTGYAYENVVKKPVAKKPVVKKPLKKSNLRSVK